MVKYASVMGLFFSNRTPPFGCVCDLVRVEVQTPLYTYSKEIGQ